MEEQIVGALAWIQGNPIVAGLAAYCAIAATLSFACVAWWYRLSRQYNEFVQNARGWTRRARALSRAVSDCAFGIVGNLLGAFALGLCLGQIDGVAFRIESYAVSLTSVVVLLLLFGMYTTWISVERSGDK